MSKIFVISGPSGSGKDSVISGLKKQGLQFREIITTTTRRMRKGETQGKPYWFISKKEFEELIKKDKMVEWAIVYGNYYGSQKKDVEKYLDDPLPVIFKVDPQGARSIKKKFPDSQVIFLIPRDLKILEKRLRQRGQDSEEAIQKRLKEAREEMEDLSVWDYVVVNEQGKLEETIKKVKKIIWKDIDPLTRKEQD